MVPLKIHKCSNFDEDLVTFGPYYWTTKSSANEILKEAAWSHLLRKTVEWNLLRGETSDEEVIKNCYIDAMKQIDKEARNVYADKMDGEVDFTEIMIKDGCFFLQLVILFLGHSAKLEYTESDPVFSQEALKNQEPKWIKSMLFVGNQIPYKVLTELMEQSFFKVVIKEMKFDHQSDLLRRTFYELLVLGGLDRNSGFSLHWWLPVKLGFSSKLFVPTQPSNLLDSLTQLVIGGKKDMPKDKNYCVVHVSEGRNDEVKISTATELREKGIKIKKVKDGKGIRGIHFANKWYSTSLRLPNLIIGEYTELMFKCIQDYELLEETYLGRAQQNQGKGKGKADEVPKINGEKLKVSSYLKFLNELVREPRDAKLLYDAGVLEADTMQRGRLLIFLKAAVQGSVAVASGNLHRARINIAEYSYAPSSWKGYLRDIGILIAITDLTYNAFSYHKKKD